MGWKGEQVAGNLLGEGKINMFVWDNIAKYKRYKQSISGVDQSMDASFLLDANSVVLSAV
jgi:hypothetical protein